MQANGRLLGHGSLNHSYPHCWRCKQPVIFRATEQWFVSMETNDFRQEALAEIERVRWIPGYGRDRINRDDRKPARLVSLASAGVGRADSWFHLREMPSYVLADPRVIEHVAALMESKGADVLV